MRTVAAILIACLIAASATAGMLDDYIDAEDDKLDMSDWLLQQHGWLPVPTLITEPAVGHGLALAGINFQLPEAGSSPTPTVAAVAGGAGFRYFIARKLGLLAGIDVAPGPEEWAVYLHVGQGWDR